MTRISCQTSDSNHLGELAEQKAAEFLIQKGLHLEASNYHSRYGEIDLILSDKDTIIFVEVRYRKSTYSMTPVETIDQRKCVRIIKTALAYMQSRSKQDTYNYRIDVISISGELDKPEIDWIQNAIEV